jgi:hypothetical protein
MYCQASQALGSKRSKLMFLTIVRRICRVHRRLVIDLANGIMEMVKVNSGPPALRKWRAFTEDIAILN